MPQQSTRWINHRFSGGWATDFGPTFYGAPQGDTLSMPWLNAATNCIFEFDGGPHKAPGTNTLNASVVNSSSTKIIGLYDYWRQGTSGTPTQRRVIHTDEGKIYHDGGTGSFSSIFSGLDTAAIPNYSTFNDLLIMGNSSTTDVPKSWDQSTGQSLAGSPPRFSFSVAHRGRQFAAGNWAAPSRLYYSVVGDPEDWTGSGSGSIDVDLGDGDMVVGLASYRNELFIFKGPNKLSIHRLSGSTPSDFARSVLIRGISATWQNAIFPMGNDLGFVSPRGTIHSLADTQNYGNYSQTFLSYPIQTWLKDNVNHSRHRYWWAATDELRGYTLIAFSLAGVTNNTRCLMMDWRFLVQGDPYPRWALWDFPAFASLAYCMDTSNRPRIFAGGYDGRVYRLDQSTRTHNSASINFDVRTPFVTYGSEYHTKCVSDAAVGIAPRSTSTVTFGWTRDGNAEQTTTFTQSAGSALDSFVLDTDVLGGSRFTQVFLQELSGDFRSVQYRLNDNNNSADIEVHNLGVALTPTGYSTEN